MDHERAPAGAGPPTPGQLRRRIAKPLLTIHHWRPGLNDLYAHPPSRTSLIMRIESAGSQWGVTWPTCSLTDLSNTGFLLSGTGVINIDTTAMDKRTRAYPDTINPRSA